MKEVGLFEAKTKLSELCAEVANTGEGVIITRRGKPLVRIEPFSGGKPKNSVWERRRAFIKKHGAFMEDFDLPPKEPQKWRNPLND